jgi:hypothetical protein
LGVPGEIREKVIKLVENHMHPSLLYIDEKIRHNRVKDGTIRNLANRIHPASIRDLVHLAEADHLGRGPFDQLPEPEQVFLSPTTYEPALWLLQRARDLQIEDSRPEDLIKGQWLLDLDFKPGKHIGMIISLSNQLRDVGFTREAVLWAVYPHPKNPHLAIRCLQDLLS